jgi:hypothetical protein
MKIIPLRDDQVFAKAILQQVAGSSPNKPIGPVEMRQRVRILDALDKARTSSC